MDLVTVNHPIIFWLLTICGLLAVFGIGAVCGALAMALWQRLSPVAAAGGTAMQIVLPLIDRFLHGGGDPGIAATLLTRAHELISSPQPPVKK